MKNKSIRIDKELERWLEGKSKIYNVGISTVIRILLSEMKFKEDFEKEVNEIKRRKKNESK